MAEPDWIVKGGWLTVDADLPVGEILEVCQLIFDHIESAPVLMSFQGGRWPVGNWHWEPEGHTSSTEPSHYRRRAAAAVAITLKDVVTA